MQKFPRNALFMATLLACASLAQAEDAATPAEGAAAAAPAAPKGPTLADIFANSGVEVKGYVDVVAEGSNVSNFGNYQGNYLAVNNIEKSNLGLHQLSLTVDKLPKEGAGGLITLTVGKDANYVHSWTGTTTPTDNFDVTAAFAQYAVGDWTYQLGKFGTLVGVEVPDSTANTNISRSMGFGLYPYTHTGVRATKALSDTSNFIIGLNNGWDQVKDMNTQKTVELGYNWAKADKSLVFNLSFYGGTEPVSNFGCNTQLAACSGVDSAQGERDVIDANLTKVFSDKFTLVLDATYATQQLAKPYTTAFSDSKPRWYTLAAYFNYQVNEKNRWSLRVEDYVDQTGFKTALATTPLSSVNNKYIQVQSFTLTYGYLVDPALEVRAEVRLDRANLPGTLSGGLFFTKSDGSQSTNNASSGSIEAVYKF
jgi:Putative beta-barrel porin-2, OmpL-like. bbp2